MSAALAGTSMSFTSGKHSPNDFSALGDAARKEAVKKGAACTRVALGRPRARAPAALDDEEVVAPRNS